MKRNIIIFGILISVFIIFSNCARQSDFPVLKGPYLGQKPPGDTPELFAPGIVSTDSIDWSITFSSDGRACFFGRIIDGKMLIMTTHEENDGWVKPRIASFSGKYDDLESHMTIDNSILYFGSWRPSSGTGDPGSLHQWYVKNTDTGWSEAYPMETPLRDYYMMNPSIAANGNMYFTYQDGDDQYIFLSRFVNGKYLKPEKFDDSVNSLKDSGHPFIDPDERYILFDVFVERRGDIIDRDAFVCFKDPDGEWGKPLRFGPEINTDVGELCLFVSRDGKYLFFSRQNDIYWVDAKVIEELKPDELK